MKPTLVLLTVALLLITTHRSPAPISEVPQTTPNPKPKREATSKSKPKTEATPKPKARPNLAFAGTWAGTTICKGSDGESSSLNYIIRISDDEKTVWINWDSEQPSGPGSQAPCNRFRETLTWSFTWPVNTFTDTLRINADGTAIFVRDGRWTGGDYEGGTYNHTGILSRRDISSTPSIPQTTPASSPQKTATSAAQIAGFPTAIPVPNKPGFVYNPFDPTKKRILDVRGIPAGTKVTIPATGKQFIVP